MHKKLDRIEMDEKPKKYCIRGMHVGIIAAVIVVVGVSVGLGVGLTRPKPCASNVDPTTSSTSAAATTAITAKPVTESCPPSNDNSGGWGAFRLPDHIIPQHYDLELQPFLDQDTYNGTVTVTLKLTKPDTSHLWLHIRETKIIGQPRLTKGSDQAIHVHGCFHYLPNEYVVVQSHNVLQANNPDDPNDTYRLTLQFSGRLNGSLVGFYRTTYEDNGVTRSIAATDHEPTDARKSFPCFDEPNKKATYTITIIHQNEYQAISNMPIEESVDLGNNWKKTRFQKSVPMSTYLVAFAVHQFTARTVHSKYGIPLTVYVQPAQQETADYAVGVTKIIFDYFEEYFNVNYSLPKLDQIAIPDFGTGAMENWGLITYRETNLLYDINESATVNKQRVASVVAHELVHQWFGNIVTMDWWDDLWLNEGFASFFEYLGVNEAEADWNMLDQIIIDDLLPVMRDDALLSSHPIIVSVSTPAEITSVFDAISYNKGASLLRMLEHWITPEKFQIGCQNYLRKYQFKNAKTDDFWASLAQASGKPVKEVMDTWLRQMGFPVLNVESHNTVKQERFLLDPKANAQEPPSEFNYKWNIPVTFYETGDRVSHLSVYNVSESAGITLTPYNNNGFLKINEKHIGFFRVNYELSTWDNLSKLLISNHTIFTPGDRAGILDDVFALASAEILSYNITLDMTQYLDEEEDYLPWNRVSASLAYLIDMLENDDTIYPKFQEYFRKKVKPISDKLGWEDTGTDIEKLLRTVVLQISCRMGDQEALGNATEKFQQWTSGNLKSIPVNLRQLVYRYGMKQSGEEKAWDFMFQKYLETPLAQEKEKLLQGMAAVENIPIIDKYLKYLYNTSLIKSQDALNVIYYISTYSKYGKQMAWDWVRINWDYLVNRYTLTDRNLGRIVLRISTKFNTPTERWQMENFFERYPEAGAGATPRKQALETVNNNIEWARKNIAVIQAWLEDNK
ncbi:glutamyl aminopeptidase [Bombina bombina]|uniref:glutamyl aminopeptidase n=1 Tax=Bombina bombina TaxID=8345 RepID=UPI00235A96DF|nr:glutamyl aminopeptidase [Bombina bombina]